MKAAAQVGLFVVVAVILLLAGAVTLGGHFFGSKRDTYVVTMPDAGGLAKGSRVLMAGVQVGEVTKVAVASPTEARLEIGIDPKTRIPHSTRALIAGSIVGLGDTPLSLVQDPVYRGPGGDYEPGETIPGSKAGPLDSILPGGGSALYDELTATLGSVRKLLDDNSLKGDVRGILGTTQNTLRASADTLRAFTRVANRTSLILNDNQAEIAQILRTSEGTLSSVQETALSIERFAKSNKLQNGADTLLADAHRIAVESQGLLADIHKTLNDPAINRDLRATLTNVKDASAKLPELTDNANKVAANVADLTAKSQDLPGKLGTVLDNAVDLEKRLGGLSDKVGGVLGGGKRPSFPPITAQIDLIRESDPNYYRTDLNLSVPLSDGFVTAGLWDAFGRNRVNLQIGKAVSPRFDYRYGIYAARPGVGVDYALTSKLGFRGDLWDINNPRFDARLRYEFGGGLIGWLGVDRIFQNPGVTIGLGVRR